MRIRSRISAFMVLALLLPVCAAAAETYIVFPFAAQAFDVNQSKAVASLLRFQLASQYGVSKATLSEESCPDSACASKALESGTADVAITGEMIKLGEKAILNLQAVRKDGTKNYSVTMANIDEFDRIAPRLAEAIVLKQSFGEAATVSTVTKKEGERYATKVEGDFRWGPTLGVFVPVGGSYLGVSPMYEILVVARYEISQVGIEMDTGLYFGSNSKDKKGATEFPLDFAAMYYFSDRDMSPFVGGSFGLHYISAWDDLTDDEKDEAQAEADRKIFEGRARAAATGNRDYLVDPSLPEDEKYNIWTGSGSAFVGLEMLRTHTMHFTARAGYRFALAALDGKGAHGAFLEVGLTF